MAALNWLSGAYSSGLHHIYMSTGSRLYWSWKYRKRTIREKTGVELKTRRGEKATEPIQTPKNEHITVFRLTNHFLMFTLCSFLPQPLHTPSHTLNFDHG
jgi:hypothetical protein